MRTLDHYLIVDLETAPLEGAEQYLDQPEAARNLKDPEKIAADLEKKQLEQRDHMSLDWNTCSIAVLGAYADQWSEPRIVAAKPDHEADILRWLADLIKPKRGVQRPVVGFYVRQFDALVLMQRARYLGVDFPALSLKRWDNPDMVDLFDVLTFDDARCTFVMRRTLDKFCQRFGLDVPEDGMRGEDVPRLIAAGDWAAVEAHCRNDVLKTKALAERLGVIRPVLIENTVI